MSTMEYKGYTTSLEFDPDDKIIVGRVMGIADIITFHAEYVSKFEKVFHQSIDAYIKDCASLKQSPEKPASGRLMHRVEPLIHAAVPKEAKRKGISLNKWAESVLKEAAHV